MPTVNPNDPSLNTMAQQHVNIHTDPTVVTVNTVVSITDPLEKAQLRLEGKCVECKYELPDHAWFCSQSDVITMNSGHTGFSINSISIADVLQPNTETRLGNPADAWKCDAFGMHGQFQIYVPEGKQPKWFHRKMQQIFFGSKWSKKQ